METPREEKPVTKTNPLADIETTQEGGGATPTAPQQPVAEVSTNNQAVAQQQAVVNPTPAQAPAPAPAAQPVNNAQQINDLSSINNVDILEGL